MIVIVRSRNTVVFVFVARIVNTVDAKYVSVGMVSTPPVVIVTPVGGTNVPNDHVTVPARDELVNVNVSCCCTAVTLRI